MKLAMYIANVSLLKCQGNISEPFVLGIHWLSLVDVGSDALWDGAYCQRIVVGIILFLQKVSTVCYKKCSSLLEATLQESQ